MYMNFSYLSAIIHLLICGINRPSKVILLYGVLFMSFKQTKPYKYIMYTHKNIFIFVVKLLFIY